MAASLGAELGLWLWLGLLLWLQLGLLLQMREMKPGRVLLLHCMVRIIPSLESNPRRIYWMMMRHRMGSRIMNMWMEMKKANIEKDQMVIDEAVKALVEMEFIQRKNEGDLEGYEEGSEYWLKFNIWKTEQD